MLSIRWPRGRYNGQRIVGVTVKADIDVLNWGLSLPTRYGGCLWLGPLRLWVSACYDLLGDHR